MTVIKDSVHDHIELSLLAMELLDTAPMQRLRRIKQLGTVSYAYPSATHTRFEHSLGVYHLSELAISVFANIDEIKPESKTAKEIRAAALLHDVGHAPYSHNIEPLLEERLGKNHEDVDDIICSGEIATILEDHQIDPDRVADLIAGETKYGQIISGEIDIDRMDYLNRDAEHAGVDYGLVEEQRLIRSFRFASNGDLVLGENNVETAESFLLSRAFMHGPVYNHRVARISRLLLQRGVEKLIDNSEYAARDVRRMDDYGLRVALRNCDQTEEYAQRLDDRNLYKGFWVEWDNVPADVREADKETVRELEQQIAEQAAIPPHHIIIDLPEEPTMEELSTQLLVGGEARNLREQSGLVGALENKVKNEWRLGIYCPEQCVEQVKSAGENVLDLQPDNLISSSSRIGEISGYPASSVPSDFD